MTIYLFFTKGLLKNIVLLCLVVLMVPALATEHTRYFCVREKLQALGPGEQAVKPMHQDAVKVLLTLFKKQGITLPYRLSPQGVLSGDGAERIKVYQGYFSNSGQPEYLFLSVAAGTLRTDRVLAVYRWVGARLQVVNFTGIVSDNLFAGEPLGPNFHAWVAKPFIYQKQRLFYLRFIDYPAPRDYDPRQLQLSTYFWRGETFKLVAKRSGIDYLSQCRR